MQLIADGKAPRVPQTEEGASYEGIQKKSNAKVRVLTPNSCPKSDTVSCDMNMLWHFFINLGRIMSGAKWGTAPDLQGP